MMAMAFMFSVSAMAQTATAPAKKEVKKECAKECKKSDKACCKKGDAAKGCCQKGEKAPAKNKTINLS